MITTAGCVVNQTDFDSIRFHIVVGAVKKEYGYRARISKIIIHENYFNNGTESDKLSHDIALILVKEKIKHFTIELANRAERVGESGNFTGD